MHIELKEPDIVQAIREYLTARGLRAPVDKIQFTKGRKGNGLTASVETGSITMSEPEQELENFESDSAEGTDKVVAIGGNSSVDTLSAPAEEEDAEEDSGNSEVATEDAESATDTAPVSGGTSLFG